MNKPAPFGLWKSQKPDQKPQTILEITLEVSHYCRGHGAHLAELRQIADMAARLARAARTLHALPRSARTLPIRHGCCCRLGLAAMLSVG